MNEPLTPQEQQAIHADKQRFEAYCLGCEGHVPRRNSDDYIRLVRSHLAWTAARKLHHE